MDVGGDWSKLSLSNVPHIANYTATVLIMISYTVNGERFTGLNFHIFHDFQEYHESVSVNIYLSFV